MSIAGRTFRSLINEVLEFQFAAGKYEPLTKTWLNDAQRIMVRQCEIRTSQETASYTTTAGVSELELPEDFARLIDFTSESGPIPQLKLPEYDALESVSGTPSAYVPSGGDLVLYPTPDGAYAFTLRYWRLPKDMSADSDEPETPAQYHALLPAYAMQKAYARENDYAASNFWKGEWEAGLLKMRGEVQSDTFDGPSQVAGSWGDVHEARQSTWR